MMQKIAIALAAAVMATGGLMSDASARIGRPGPGVHGFPMGHPNWGTRLGHPGIYGGAFPHNWGTRLGRPGIKGPGSFRPR